MEQTAANNRAPPLSAKKKKQKKKLPIIYIFFHAAQNCFSEFLSNVNTLVRRYRPSISTYHQPTVNPLRVSGKASECRWRPRTYHAGPWSRRRERSPAVSYALHQILEKMPIFCLRRGDGELSSSVSTHQRDRRLFVIRLAGARYISPGFV